MRTIYYDPAHWAWIPQLDNYQVEPYNPPISYLVRKIGEEGVNVVDLADYGGKGSCTCHDFAFRKEPANGRLNILDPSRDTVSSASFQPCKHISLVRYLLNRHVLDT